MPTFELEMGIQRQGFFPVAGVDEAGRGPLAGPVVAAAVVLPPFPPVAKDPASVPRRTLSRRRNSRGKKDWLRLVDDSKALTARQREWALKQIEVRAASIGVGMASPQEIDSNGIVQATRWAMRRAIENLPLRPSYLLVDFVQLSECGIPFQGLTHGDSLCYCIAAASIVAKVTRDRIMEEADVTYPGYGFSRHKGYATPQHLRQLALQGPSPIHRRSFSPIRIDDVVTHEPGVAS